ncbi:MAG: FmdB family zinc ribbon protein [Desulfohalobiaceae bacterium]
MILYDFQCQDCNLQFEELLSSRQGLCNVTCPRCQSKQVRQLPSAAKGKTGSSKSAADAGASGCSPAAGFS